MSIMNKDLQGLLAIAQNTLPVFIENHHDELCDIEVKIELRAGKPIVILKEVKRK